jgi:hypothetical protein
MHKARRQNNSAPTSGRQLVWLRTHQWVRFGQQRRQGDWLTEQELGLRGLGRRGRARLGEMTEGKPDVASYARPDNAILVLANLSAGGADDGFRRTPRVHHAAGRRGGCLAGGGAGAAGRWNATCCRSHGHRDHRAWTILAELLAFSPSDGIPW